MVASWRSLNWLSCPLSTHRTTPATTATARWRSSVLDTARPAVREQAARAHHQHRDEDGQGAERHHLGAEIARHVAEREAQEEAADERAGGALQAAEHRGGEAEHEHGIEVR